MTGLDWVGIITISILGPFLGTTVAIALFFPLPGSEEVPPETVRQVVDDEDGWHGVDDEHPSWVQDEQIDPDRLIALIVKAKDAGRLPAEHPVPSRLEVLTLDQEQRAVWAAWLTSDCEFIPAGLVRS